MADEKQPSALIRRHEQLKRWEDSDTNKAPNTLIDKPRKVKFQDGCIFLAACSSGDRDEVQRLLKRGADINTANVDGLTALHQACIDDNLDMVEFLVHKCADVDVCDNEGWTPLHATASCGFTEIARYLLQEGASVAAVNNDGDLPIDICEDEDMEKLLQQEMDKQGVDADAARSEEENQMLADANKWLNNKSVKEKRHPKTGATALHVACAKGYMKVISVLMSAGADVNAQDNDGWTPLHAAAHWGQEEACKVLTEHMCDMETKNKAGQTAWDVADTEIIKLLDELKKKQASQKDKLDSENEIIQTRGQHQKRRSSVTRMSVDQKQSVIMKTVEQERAVLEEALHHNHPGGGEEEEKVVKSSSSSASSEESSEESETEKQNEINKKSSNQQPRDRDKPPITTVEIQQKPETTKVDERGDVQISPKDNQNEADRNENGMDEVPKIEKIGDSLDKLTRKCSRPENIKRIGSARDQTILEFRFASRSRDLKRTNEKEKQIEAEEKEKSEKDQEKSEEKEKSEDIVSKEDKLARKKDRISRSLSAPAKTPSESEVPVISIQKPEETEKEVNKRDIPSWRAGLRKTGSTSMVIDTINEVDNTTLPRSASSPRLALENNQVENEKSSHRKSFPSTSTSSSENQETKVPDRLGSSNTTTTTTTSSLSSSSTSSYSRSNYTPYRSFSSYNTSSSSYQSAYVPYYHRRQEENERKEREKDDHRVSLPARPTQPSTTASSSLTPSSTISSTTSVGMTTTTTSMSISSSISSPYHNYQFSRSSYIPPKRDDEAETQRKARAKRARETRRSTQGVTLEDIQKAEEVLSSAKSDSDRKDTSVSADSKNREISSTTLQKDSDSSNIKDRTSYTSSDISKKDNTSEDTVLLRRNRAWESDRKDDDIRSSYRRSRDSKDISSTDTVSGYIPRRERNALSSVDSSSSSLLSGSASTGLSRSQSLRNRIWNGEMDSRVDDSREDRKDKTTGISSSLSTSVGLSRSQSLRNRSRNEEVESRVKDSSGNKKENLIEKENEEKSRRESTALARRRHRRERRSTGIVQLNDAAKDEEDEKEKDEKEDRKERKEEDKKDTDEKSVGSRYTRYGSSSDVHDRYSRPISYTEHSKSTTSLDGLDYKKLYEDEKSSSERLKRELEQTKKDLIDAKSELDRLLKRNELARVSDTNEKREKRALERKLSEYEEELKKMEALKEDNKRLKEENGALIRVISKLSK